MINYITRATAVLALVQLNSVATIATHRDNKDNKRRGLRKLYYSQEGHEVTDVQTKCEQVIEGYPKQCIIVCVEVTSIKSGDALVDEYSKVKQHECEAGWEHDGRGDGDEDVDWDGQNEWPEYSPKQFPTSYPTGWADDGRDADTALIGDGRDRVVDWTHVGPTSYTDEVLLLLGGSKGSKSGGGYSKGTNGGYSKSSKSTGGKGIGQSKSSKGVHYGDVEGGEGSGHSSKSSKSSGLGSVGDWDATIPEPIHDEWGVASWSSGAGITGEDKVSSSSKSSKTESVGWSGSATVSSKSSKIEFESWSDGAGARNGSGSSKSSKPISESASWSRSVGDSSKSAKQDSGSWSSGAGVVKEGNGSVSSKSSKLVADSGEWESAKLSGGGKGSGSSKSSKPAGSSADILDGKGSIYDGESGGWSGGAAL